jgi:two-component system, NarL family, response regulator DesR
VPDPIRILIAEDNDDLRATMVALLDAETDINCVAETDDFGSIAALAAASSAQVIILDVQLKGQSSLHGLAQLKRELPTVRVLVYSGHSLPAFVQAALKAGASEYLLKSGDPYELIAAVRRCAAS